MSLRRNVLWNLAGAGLPLAFGAALIPYLLRSLGIERFGILTLVWALVGYFSLFDLGLGRALTQQVARQLAAGSRAELPSLVRSGLLLATAMGALGGVALVFVAEPLAVHGLQVSEALHVDVFHALLMVAVGVPLTTATVGLRGVLEAFEDFRDVNLLRMLLGIASFGLPALSVALIGPSLVPIVALLMAARLVVGVAHWVLVRRRLGGGFGGVPMRREHFRQLLAFGAWITVSSVLSPLMVTADRFAISAVLGAAVVAYYTVPAEVLARLLILPGALTSALFPRLASLLIGEPDAARRLYRRCLAVVVLALLPVCAALALGAHWALTWWLGADFAARSAPLVSILALGLLLNGVAFVPFAAIQAAGLARLTAQLHMAEAVLYFPLLLLGLHRLGLAGAALAWTARVGVDLIVLLFIAQRRVFAHGADAPMRHNLPNPEPERS